MFSSAHNFPDSCPVGAVFYNMVRDFARVYLLYGPTSRDIFQARDEEDTEFM